MLIEVRFEKRNLTKADGLRLFHYYEKLVSKIKKELSYTGSWYNLKQHTFPSECLLPNAMAHWIQFSSFNQKNMTPVYKTYDVRNQFQVDGLPNMTAKSLHKL